MSWTTARAGHFFPIVTANVAATTDSSEIEEAPASKPKGNKLGRALSAPFRALSKLFGGGKKAGATSAKKRVDAPAPQAPATTAVAESASIMRKQEPVNRNPEAREGQAGISGMADTRLSSPAGQVKIVRPAEGVAPGRTWIPVIEGIPRDPLSQGRALLQHGYLNEAISELSIAAGIGPNLVEANNLLGLAYDRRGWHRMAIECYERALSVAPKDAVVLGNLGNSLYLDADYNGALKRLKQAERLAPNAPVIAGSIGFVQVQRGNYKEAFKSFARASGEYDAHLKMAEFFETARREKDAVKHYEAALRIQPDASAVLERLVALYERTGRRTEAEAARRTLGQPKNPQKTATGG